MVYGRCVELFIQCHFILRHIRKLRNVICPPDADIAVHIFHLKTVHLRHEPKLLCIAVHDRPSLYLRARKMREGNASRPVDLIDHRKRQRLRFCPYIMHIYLIALFHLTGIIHKILRKLLHSFVHFCPPFIFC